MEQNTKVTAILEALKGDYPEPRCALEYQKDYELMVAVRLSRPVHRCQGQRGDACPLCRLSLLGSPGRGGTFPM